jgi:D-aminopeptidase
MHVTREHVLAALTAAKDGTVEEGAVGAGTGTIAFGWKGGIGTSSRKVRQQGDTWTVGVLVQTNYGGRLTVAGVPVWRELTPARDDGPAKAGRHASRRVGLQPDPDNGSVRLQPDPSADGSCMVVVATDAPLDARDLRRLAARAVFALARTGSTYSNGSGDYAIAFSTHPSLRVTSAAGPQPRTILPTDAVSALFEATLDATEEAVYNSLLKATDTTGNGRTIRALPIDQLNALLKKYGR